MQYWRSLWLAAATVDALMALLAGWYLLRLYRQLTDEAVKRLVFYFLMACFGAAVEAGTSRVTVWWSPEVSVIARSIARLIAAATMLMLSLKLLGYVNGHAGVVAWIVKRGSAVITRPRRLLRRLWNKLRSPQ